MASQAGAARAKGTTLTREQIVDEAIRLVESEGSRAFSMNALAQRFEVTTMALYWHYRNREALLVEMHGRLMEQLRLPADDLSWDVWLSEYARRYRDLMHRYPHTAVMLSTTMETKGSPDYRVAEKLMSICEQAGFTGSVLVQVYNLYVITLVGFVATELAELPSHDAEEWAKGRREEVESLDPDEFPTLTAQSAYLETAAVLRWRDGASAPLDATFELFLDTLIGSLRTRSPRTGKAR